jgi:hypothetical protein
VLGKVLQGEELVKMCEYMQEKQEELTKQRSTITNLSRKDTRNAVHKYFSKPIQFTRIPKKPTKVEKLASMTDVRYMF